MKKIEQLEKCIDFLCDCNKIIINSEDQDFNTEVPISYKMIFDNFEIYNCYPESSVVLSCGHKNNSYLRISNFKKLEYIGGNEYKGVLFAIHYIDYDGNCKKVIINVIKN